MAERRITGQINSPGRSLPRVPDFTSAEQTVTVDTLLDVAHGLGAVPTLWQVVLRCTTANANYSQGDETVPLISHTTADTGATLSADATNITVVQGSQILVHDKSTFNAATTTTTSWRWVVRAWA